MKRATGRVVAVAAALALPLSAVGAAHAEPAPEPSHPGPLSVSADPAAVSRAVVAAAEEAAATRQARTFAAPAPDDRAAALDRMLADTVADVPIAVTARVETPELSWRGAAGVRELGGGAPAQPQDRFRVASITKSMVATLVLQEVEAGTWSLDTTVDEVLPGALPVEDVTLEQLLSHRSGLPDHLAALILSRMSDPTSIDEQFEVLGEEYTDADHVAAFSSLPWLFEPGTGMSYSNAGYVLLGLMLEEVTGRSVEDLLEERVFAPAGMRHSAYPDDPGTRGPFLVGAAHTGPFAAGWYSLGDSDPSLFAAAGAATSTTADLHAFTEALVTGQLLDAATVTNMTTPRTEGFEYGLGVYRMPDPCVPGGYLYGHDGATFGTLSAVFTSLDGERQLSVGFTGRDYIDSPIEDLENALVPLMLATC